MKRGLWTTVAALICAMTYVFGLVACNNKETPNENEPGNGGTQTVAVESVTLNKTELTLEVGGEETLTATVAPDDATDKTVTWSSDNTAIATVENGKVTAIAAGTATITAKAGDKTDTCSVTVKAPLTEDTDFDALVSDKVTEDEWKAAFSESAFQNATIECLVEESGQSSDNSGYLKIQGNMRYMFAENTYGYFVEDGEQKLVYLSEDGESFMEYPEDEEMLDGFFSFKLLCPDFSADYADFTYNEDEGAYVCNTIIQSNPPLSMMKDFDYTNIYIKIIDGKLAAIVCDRAGYDEHYEFHMYDYGKTVVTPPAILESRVA